MSQVQPLTITSTLKRNYLVLLLISFFQAFFSYTVCFGLQNPSIAVIDSLQTLSHSLLQEDPQKAMHLGQQALSLAMESDEKQKITRSLHLIGAAHLVRGEHHSALNHFYRSLKISRSENLKKETIAALDDIGIVYFRLGDFQNALFYLTESLKVNKELDDKQGVAYSLNHIGNVYQKLKDHHVALKYYKESIQILEKIGDDTSLIGTLNNLGNLHFQINKYDEAIDYYERSIAISVENNVKKGLSDTYKGLGLVNEGLNDLSRAEENYLHSLQLSIEKHEKINISEIYYHLARLAFESKRFEEALELNFKSYELALDMSAKERLKDNYDLYAKIYAKLKDFEGAYSYITKANTLKDFLFNESVSHSLSNIQMAEEEAKYRQMLHFKDLEIEAGKAKATFLSIILVLLLALSVLGYFIYKNKSNQQKELSLKNDKISHQNKEIEQQKDILEENIKQLEIAHQLINEQNSKLCNVNEQLDELVKAKTAELITTNGKLKTALKELDTFIYKTSHDIKGPLARLMGLCNVALLDIKHKKSVEYFEMLNITANYLNSTLVRLLTVIDIKNNDIEDEKIDFEALIEDVLKSNAIHEGFDNIRIDLNVDKKVEFSSDPTILNLILHNLIENSIKYYKKFDEPDPFIALTVQAMENKVQITIIDNGMGINRENLHLFEIFSRANNNSQAAGLGLYMIKVCVEKIGGTIELVDNPSNHTEFNIQLPLKKRTDKKENILLHF